MQNALLINEIFKFSCCFLSDKEHSKKLFMMLEVVFSLETMT